MNIDIKRLKQSSQISEFINEFITKKHKTERNNEIPQILLTFVLY